MQYQDEMEEEESKVAEDEEDSGSDTDWSRLAQAADVSASGTPGGRRRGRGRTYRGGVRKK